MTGAVGLQGNNSHLCDECCGCAGKNFTEHQLGTLEYSAEVGQAWGVANQRALMWAGERATAVHGTHSVVRCAGSLLRTE